MSQEQIAIELGCDQATVSRRIARGLEALRVSLARMGLATPLAILAGHLEAHANATMLPTMAPVTGRLGTLACRPHWLYVAATFAAATMIITIVTVSWLSQPGPILLVSPESVMSGLPKHETVPSSRPPRRPDLSDLHLRGFGMERDSVAVALQAAGQVLGRSVTYERILLLTGNAAAPAIDPSEHCRSWWHVRGSLGAINLAETAASVGLAAKVLHLPPRPVPDGLDQSTWMAEAARVMGDVMDSGAVVLVEGGWDEPGTWNWAGIITTVDPGALRGVAQSAATGDGKMNLLWRWPARAWAIRDNGDPTGDDRQPLRAAVDRLRGTGRFAPRADAVYGIAAMDLWIEVMRRDRGFCAECYARVPVSGIQDGADNDRRMRVLAAEQAKGLRSLMQGCPSAARAALQRAAGCYDRIAVLFASPVGTQEYDQSLTSLEAQRDHAARVLIPARAEMEEATGHLEQALTAWQ